MTAGEFEIAIGRAALPDGLTPLFTGSTFRLLLRDSGPGGDQAPDTGGMVYSFDAGVSLGAHLVRPRRSP